MPDDSLVAICTDLLQLRDEIDNSEHRPAADEICARLTLLASRVDALTAEVVDVPIPEVPHATVQPSGLDQAAGKTIRPRRARGDLGR